MKHEVPTIAAKPRERLGTRYARRLRTQGRLPAVIYGHRSDPVAVSVDAGEILNHVRQGRHVMRVEVEGARRPETCLVRQLQFGYLGDNVVHVDFTRVDLEEEVKVRVSLHFVGQPAAAQKAGAILSHNLTDLEVVCKVTEIPGEIRVDLGQMGDRMFLTVGEIALPPGVRAAADPATTVAHVSMVHRAEAVGEEAEVAAGPAEPEVIAETKREAREKEAG